MRAANISAGVIAILWIALFVVGHNLVDGVFSQGIKGYPNAAQINYLIIIPLLAVVITFGAAWISNIVRAPRFLFFAATAVGLAIFPYFFFYTGGI